MDEVRKPSNSVSNFIVFLGVGGAQNFYTKCSLNSKHDEILQNYRQYGCVRESTCIPEILASVLGCL
jgi:hypothetical protein